MAAVALAALAFAGPAAASAKPDSLGSGEIELDLNLPAGVSTAAVKDSRRIGKDEYELAVYSGGFDPITGKGLIHTDDEGIEFRYGGETVRTGAYDFQFGGGAKVTIRVNGRTTGLATTKAGKLSRDGFGASLEGARLTMSRTGAKQLNKAIGGGDSPFRPGPLGQVSLSYKRPSLVGVVGGDMAIGFEASFLASLAAKGVSVSVASPAALTGATAAFPLTGREVSLTTKNFSVLTGAGSLTLTKSQAVSAACDAAAPVGRTFTFSRLDFDHSSGLSASFVSPSDSGRNLVITERSGTPTVAANAETRQVTLSATQLLDDFAAEQLNTAFGTAAAGCGADLAARQPFGLLSAVAETR